jgi:DNA-binding MarR family transcriptional regulator
MQNNIAFLTSDVSRLLRKRFDVVSRRFGVTGPQWRMLAVLRRTPGINQGALAQWLEVEAITAGRMIDRLEKAELVERRADPNDRRAWRLFLTEAASPLLDELFGCAREVFDEALQGFAEAEHVQLLALLERVRANLLDEAPPEKALAEKALAEKALAHG